MSFKKVEKTKVQVAEEEQNADLTFTEQSVNAYKFEVKLIVSLFAENYAQALEQLDAQGGFIASRKVDLLEVTEVHNVEKDE